MEPQNRQDEKNVEKISTLNTIFEDLIKILGNESQFRHWVTEFLIKDNILEEIQESNHTFYRKTENGKFFHRLLKNGKIVRALLRVSGKRLRRND